MWYAFKLDRFDVIAGVKFQYSYLLSAAVRPSSNVAAISFAFCSHLFGVLHGQTSSTKIAFVKLHHTVGAIFEGIEEFNPHVKSEFGSLIHEPIVRIMRSNLSV